MEKYKELSIKLRKLSDENKLDEIVSVLKGIDWISNDEKAVIYRYYGPTIYLKDHELCNMIRSYRNGSPGIIGTDPYIIDLMMIAYKSPQYHRFFMHILSRYNESIIKVDDNESHDCCICYDKIYGMKMNPDDNKIAYSSNGTATYICKSCLIQLMTLSTIISKLNE